MAISSDFFLYCIYGLAVASELEFPELAGTEPPGTEPVVYIGKTSINSHQHNVDLSKKFDWQITDKYFTLYIQDTGIFSVTDGREIAVEIAEKADMSRVRLFILGTCFGFLLHQRNILPIHGCAIATTAGCKVFAGSVGSGKSTLAAGFMKTGRKILADDVSAMSLSDTQRPYIHPSYPQLKVCPDSAAKLAISTEDLSPIDAKQTKFRLPVSSWFYSQPMPLSAIYFLTTHHESSYQVQQIYGAEKFQNLLTHTYRSILIKKVDLKNSHFDLCASLSNLVPMYRILRPANSFEIFTFLEFLENHFSR